MRCNKHSNGDVAMRWFSYVDGDKMVSDAPSVAKIY